MSEWNSIDRKIAKIRYRTIKKYIPQSGVIADIGCGQEAAFLKYCAPQIKKGYGFDFRIQNYKTENLTLINNRHSQGLELKSGCCDTVFMLAVLEHLDNPENLIQEANRILKPGGTLVLTTPTIMAKPVLECMAFQLHLINVDEILEHKHYYVNQEIGALLKQCGFSKYKYQKFLFGMNSLAVAVKMQGGGKYCCDNTSTVSASGWLNGRKARKRRERTHGENI